MFYGDNSVGLTPAVFMHKVYAWMAFALTLTAGTAYVISHTPGLMTFVARTPAFLLFSFLIQFGLVIYLSARIMSMSVQSATLAFCVYSFLTGVTLSTIFLVYQIGTIYSAFLVTAGMFGTMALYGYFTNSDLTGVGSMARMALFGLIIALFVNMFIRSSGFDLLLSIVGVLVFTALTAYDVQKIKFLAQRIGFEEAVIDKIAILGALTLYLDFINIFLSLLRIMGRGRRD